MDSLTSQARSPLPAKSRGFNLIEAAIVLGVVGLVIGSIWVAAAAVMAENRQREARGALLQIISKVTEMSYKQPSVGYSATVLMAMGLSMPALGVLYLSSASLETLGARANTIAFRFTRPDGTVPQDDCITLGRAIYALGGSFEMIFDAFNGEPSGSTPASLDQFISNCSEDLSNSEILAWVPAR